MRPFLKIFKNTLLQAKFFVSIYIFKANYLKMWILMKIFASSIF